MSDLKLVPKRRVALAQSDAEVDRVRERMIPVGPVVGAYSVIATDVTVERSYEHDVGVHVDAAVLDHEIDPPDVSHVRQYVHSIAVHLRAVRTAGKLRQKGEQRAPLLTFLPKFE